MRINFLFVLCLFAATACDTETHYKNSSEFEGIVQSWRLEGKPENEAIAILEKNNFFCKKQICYRDLRGIPCNQRLNVTLVVNNKGEVVSTSILKLPNGKLPTVCL